MTKYVTKDFVFNITDNGTGWGNTLRAYIKMGGNGYRRGLGKSVLGCVRGVRIGIQLRSQVGKEAVGLDVQFGLV